LHQRFDIYKSIVRCNVSTSQRRYKDTILNVSENRKS
jgi:hypothetical protein